MKKIGEAEHIIAALAQRGQPQGDDVEAEEQILAELAFPHPVFKVAVGGGEHAHIHFHGFRAAHAVYFPFLQHSEQLGLQAELHFGNFVQQQGAASGKLEFAEFAGNGPGKGPFFVPEEFAFQKMFRQGGAVDGDKGLVGPVTVAVQIAGKHFLARAGLARYEHRGL
jgi:hypothetical protein